MLPAGSKDGARACLLRHLLLALVCIVPKLGREKGRVRPKLESVEMACKQKLQ